MKSIHWRLIYSFRSEIFYLYLLDVFQLNTFLDSTVAQNVFCYKILSNVTNVTSQSLLKIVAVVPSQW